VLGDVLDGDEVFIRAGGTRRARHERRSRDRFYVALGLSCIGVGLLIVGNIAWFYYRSDTKGAALVRQEHAAIAAAGQYVAKGQAPAAKVCPPFSDSSNDPQGLVEAPGISLQAPVLAGDADAELNVAVGHVTGSAWPGQYGTAVLAAHDVSYFSEIDNLHAGDGIEFVTPCETYTYRVTGHQVVARGSPLYSPKQQSILVLETCYPLNALFLTPQRYLVTAQYTGVIRTGESIPAIAGGPPAPTVPAPAPLAAQGLTLATNDVPLGRLDLTGSPAVIWQESPDPLTDESSVLAAYFAGLRSAEQVQPGWWAAIAGSVPLTAAQPLEHAAITGYPQQVNPTLVVGGSTLTGAFLDTTVRVSGGSAPGVYQLHVAMTDSKGTLTITQWTMTRG